MNKLPLDLSKFRKVKSDGKTSTFQHYEGHELTIAHGKLSKKLREQLESLPMAKPKAGKEGVEKFDEGGVARPGRPPGASPSLPPSSDDSSDVAAPSSPPGVVATPTPAPNDGDTSLPSPGRPPGMISVTPSDNQGVPVTDSSLPQGQPAPMQPGGELPAAQTPDSNPWQSTMDAANQAQLGAIEEQKAGGMATAAANASVGAERIKQEGAYQKQAEAVQNAYVKANSVLTQERQNLQYDIATFKVNPKQYLDNMSTGGKIATGIGLILGGMGAGLTHGPNLAFQYLQNQIDRDIDSQKADLGKKENLLSHNLQATNDLRSAYDLTRLHTNDMLASHLRQAADSAASPMAKATMLTIAGHFDAESAQLQSQIAMRHFMMGASRGQGDESGFQNQMQFLRMNGQEAMAKDMEAKHVPGVGQASREVPQDVMAQLIARNDLQNKIEGLKSWAAKNSGSLNPATINEGRAKAQLVQDAYRRANQQGVFKESEAHFVNGIVNSDPTQFFEKYRAGKGYQAMGEDNLATLNSLKKGYGLPVANSGAQGGAPQIKTVGGKRYMRGPNGEAIPVN